MKMNQKQLERAMKQMGVIPQEIAAEEVIIRMQDKEIVITDPQVLKIKMMGQEQFQISGSVSERHREPFSPEDVAMVAQQTGSSETEAKAVLHETHGDLAQSIMRLQKRK